MPSKFHFKSGWRRRQHSLGRQCPGVNKRRSKSCKVAQSLLKCSFKSNYTARHASLHFFRHLFTPHPTVTRERSAERRLRVYLCRRVEVSIGSPLQTQPSADWSGQRTGRLFESNEPTMHCFCTQSSAVPREAEATTRTVMRPRGASIRGEKKRKKSYTH